MNLLLVAVKIASVRKLSRSHRNSESVGLGRTGVIWPLLISQGESLFRLRALFVLDPFLTAG